jgi:MFS family permease
MADVRRASGPPDATLPDGAGPLSVGERRKSGRLTTPRGFTSVLKNPLFLRLWMAQLISQTIMNAANYAMIVLVTKESDSSFATSGAIVAFSLPALFLGAPAGVLVDRFDRRLVLWVSNILRAVASIVFVFTLILAPHSVWPVYALTFFIAMVGQFFTPAEGAAIPRLVHRSELINALALFNITFTLAQAAGLIVIGPLALLFIPGFHVDIGVFSFTFTSIMSLFIFITALYIVCALLILAIPKRLLTAPSASVIDERGVKRRHEGARLKGIWSGILESYRFIRADASLHISVWQLTLAGIVISVVAMIAPRFVKVFFHQPPELAALVFIPAGIGLVIGSIATPNIARRLKYRRTLTAGVILLAGSIALLVSGYASAPYIFGRQWWSAWPYLGIMLTATFLIGIGLDLINVPAQTMMQARSPDWVKGRVLAVQIMLLNGIIVVFIPIIGWIADSLGLPTALLIVAGAVGAAGALSIYLGARAGSGIADIFDDRKHPSEGGV